MVQGTKNEETLFLFVPVTPHAAKNGSAIVQCMSGDADLGLGVGDDPALEIRVLW